MRMSNLISGLFVQKYKLCSNLIITARTLVGTECRGEEICEWRFSVSLHHNFINNEFVFETGETLNIFTTKDI